MLAVQGHDDQVELVMGVVLEQESQLVIAGPLVN